MSFLVKACLDDRTLSVMTATAKKAFAKAIEWQLAGRFDSVTIIKGTNTYSIEAFSVAMALLEIAKTVNAAAETTAEG
jgi:hypothetical protein